MGFPFTIEDEAKLLPLKNARLTGGTIYADCPMPQWQQRSFTYFS